MKYALNYERPEPPAGSVLVFCPATGSETTLEENARSLLAQTHPNYRVLFIVESQEDPAWAALSGIEGAELFVAGLATDSGQKVHNLSEAVRSAGSSADILVFSDSDARFPEDWLWDLIAPLSDGSVGASTGYRWYLAPNRRLNELLRSAWNASVAGFLGPHNNNFVWGGSTAIRRDVFDRAGVLAAWKGALSDDYALTEALRRAGLGVVFVPTCIVPSEERSGWRDLFEFTTRQIKITRVYAGRIWAIGLVSYTLFNLTFVWLAWATFLDPVALALWLVVYSLAVIRSGVRLKAVRVAGEEFGRPSWFYLLSPPLVSLLYQVNFIASALSRRIRWKGVSYRMISPSETRLDRA